MYAIDRDVRCCPLTNLDVSVHVQSVRSTCKKTICALDELAISTRTSRVCVTRLSVESYGTNAHNWRLWRRTCIQGCIKWLQCHTTTKRRSLWVNIIDLQLVWIRFWWRILTRLSGTLCRWIKITIMTAMVVCAAPQSARELHKYNNMTRTMHTFDQTWRIPKRRSCLMLRFVYLFLDAVSSRRKGTRMTLCLFAFI